MASATLVALFGLLPAIASASVPRPDWSGHETIAAPSLAATPETSANGFSPFVGDELGHPGERFGRDPLATALHRTRRPERIRVFAGIVLRDRDLTQDPYRGLAPRYPETRVGGLGLPGEARVGAERSLRLGAPWACGERSCGRAAGSGEFRIFDPANSPRTVSSYGWNRLFQGREYLGMFDGYDFRARILWPELGRFGQEDPAGTGDSLNPYQAVGGQWTRLVDPTGLEFMPDEADDGPVYGLQTGTLAHYVWQKWVRTTHGSYMGLEDDTAWYDKTVKTIAGRTKRPPPMNPDTKPDAARWDRLTNSIAVWELKPTTWDPDAVGLVDRPKAMAKLDRARIQIGKYLSALNPAAPGDSVRLNAPSPGNSIVDLGVIPGLPGTSFKMTAYSRPQLAGAAGVVFYRLVVNGKKEERRSAAATALGITKLALAAGTLFAVEATPQGQLLAAAAALIFVQPDPCQPPGCI